MTAEPAFESWPVELDVAVKWGEMDAYQHLNNTVYFRYFEDARIAYFERVDLHRLKEQTGIGPILASTRCRFRVPLTYPDTVTVAARVAELGDDRFRMEYQVRSHRHGKIAAEGGGVLVPLDYATGRKVPLPDVLRQRIDALESL